MDENTRNIFQQLLDLSRSNNSKIAELKAVNTIYHFVILEILDKTNVFENLSDEVRNNLEGAIASAQSMIVHAENRATFDTLVELVESKLEK